MCHKPGVVGRCFHRGSGTGLSPACQAAGFWLKAVVLCRDWEIQPQGLEAELWLRLKGVMGTVCTWWDLIPSHHHRLVSCWTLNLPLATRCCFHWEKQREGSREVPPASPSLFPVLLQGLYHPSHVSRAF